MANCIPRWVQWLFTPLGLLSLVFMAGCIFLLFVYLIKRYPPVIRWTVFYGLLGGLITNGLSAVFRANMIIFGNLCTDRAATFSPLTWMIYGFFLGVVVSEKKRILHGLLVMVSLLLTLMIWCSQFSVKLWTSLVGANFVLELILFTALFIVMFGAPLVLVYAFTDLGKEPALSAYGPVAVVSRAVAALLITIVAPFLIIATIMIPQYVMRILSSQ